MKLPSILAASLFTVTVTSTPLLQRQSQPIPQVTDPTTQVTYIGNATFLGNTTEYLESFLNIRFGQDTGGSNRFKAPVPYTYSPKTIVNASLPGAACPQQKVPVEGIPVFSNVTDYSEDCLTLRIDRPAGVPADAKLPVMVWIYGGGFNIGQIYDQAYTPTGLVASSAAKGMPIIYVAMNYRVGIFGFAATPAICPDDLNAGLLDQRLALEWVQQNIAIFGGDPDNVTIFGESAGANSVGLHLVSYAGNEKMGPPFKRAIMESGGPTANQGITGNETAYNTATVASRVNCTSQSGNYSEELSCLRAVPLPTLLNVAVNLSLTLTPFGGFGTYGPVAPSTIIPAAPSELIANGSFYKNIDLISGWAEDDGALFVPDPSILRTEADVQGWLEQTTTLSNNSIEEVLQLYPSSDFPDDPAENVTAQWFRASEISRDSNDLCPSLLINAAMANASNTNTTNYLYALNSTLFAAFFAADNASYLGVTHFSDIAYVFDQASYPLYQASEANIELSGQVSGSWAAFAEDGDAQGSSANLTVDPWLQGATANSSEQFGVRILGGPENGMATIEDTAGSSVYGQDLVRKCQFWNSMEVLQESET